MDAAVLVVRRSRGEVNGKIIESTPKSKRSLRTIELDPGTIDVLRARRIEQNEHRLMVGPGWREGDYVFTKPDGQPSNPGVVSKVFRRLVDSSDLPRIPLHGLGHTHATILLAAGESPRVVADRRGQSSIAFMLDIYAESLPGQDMGAANAFGTWSPEGRPTSTSG